MDGRSLRHHPRHFDSIAQKLERTKQTAERFAGKAVLGIEILSKNTAREIVDRIQTYQRGLATAYQRLDTMKAEINAWIGEQLSKVLSGKHSFEADGFPGSNASRAQRATAPPADSGALMPAGAAPPSHRIPPARDKLAELSREELESIRRVNTFKPQGVSAQRARAFLVTTEEGQELLRQVTRSASPGTPADKIFDRAVDWVMTGKDVPLATAAGPLVKIVPEGSGVSPYSPFFTTPEALAQARASGRPLSDVFGLPAASDAARYDVYEIRPIGDATAFRSVIAPTEELGGKLTTQGGAIQMVVADRSQFGPAERLYSIDDNLPGSPQ